jgi:hypothetical protein
MTETEPTDLVCRSRRETLPVEERRRFERLRATSVEVRLVEGILLELDKESVVRRGDDALAVRMAASAASWNHRVSARRFRVPHLLVAAFVLLFVGTAAAVWWRGRSVVNHEPSAPGSQAVSVPQSASCVSGSAAVHGESLVHVSNRDEAPASPAEPDPREARASSELDSHERARVVARHRIDAARPAAPETADGSNVATLLARANLLRRQGQNAAAISLYRAIVDGYPTAREVPLARLALAKLMATSNPAQALVQYQLLAKTNSTLRAEALWGVAQFARQLGRRAEEKRALADLTIEFPDSPYAEVARERLRNAAP